jgi:GTP-binding protein Era
VGRPNVGKSSLLNALVGTKVAIVTPRPQTTRTRVTGIWTEEDAQVVFVDTPGIHAARSLLNRRMVDVARRTVHQVDVVVLVIDATAGVTAEDRELSALAEPGVPRVVVLNKRDRVPPSALLPAMASLGALLPGCEVIPASALTGENVPLVRRATIAVLPEGPLLHSGHVRTTEAEHFLIQELVREQVFLQTKEEVPYGTAVAVDSVEHRRDRDVVVVRATILVDRAGHKGIVIGTGGQRLREIGERARRGIEARCGKHVFLELFVRVEPGWARDPKRLEGLGL